MKRIALLFACSVFALGGCSGGDGAADAGFGQDGDGDVSDPQDFPFAIGTGRVTFQPLEDGDTVYLERGFQGLQHVLVSARAWGLEEARYLVDFSLTRVDDDELVSEPSSIRLPFLTMDDEDGVEITGYQLVVADPDAAEGYTTELRVEMTGPEETRSAARVMVDVEWAPEGWDPDAP